MTAYTTNTFIFYIPAILLKVVLNTINLPSKLVFGETRNQQLGKLRSSISVFKC